LLESDAPLHYHSGEENSLARAHGLTLADTAAAFLADALGEPYDWRDAHAERQKDRARLRQLYTDPRRRATAR
jgi:hypothetical protein